MSEKKTPTVNSTDFPLIGVSSNSIRIQWEMAAIDGVPVEEFVYKVYYKQAGTDESYRVAYQSRGISSYTITGLKPDTDYLVRVVGADETGNSIYYPGVKLSKKIRTDITPAVQETPDGDDEVSPGNDDEEAPTVDSTEFKNVKVTFDSIHIGWKKATDSVTAAKKIVYKVFVKEDIDTEDEFVAKEAPNLTSFTIKDLKPGTDYLVYVRAYDEAGNYIQYPAPDETLRIRTDVVDEEAPVVRNAAFKNVCTTPDSIYVAWDPAEDNLTSSEKIHYCVYLKEDNDSGNANLVKQGLNILSHTFTGLKDKTDYLVHVIAFDDAGNWVRYPAQDSSYKVRTGIMDKEAPAASETSFTLGEVTTGTITISWEKATDNLTEAEKILYKVYIQEDGSKEEPILTAEGTDLLSHTFTGLKKDTDYLVHVLAFDEAGNCLRYPAPNSSFKVKTDITDDHAAPAVKSRAIRLIRTTISSISIEWEPATDNVTKQNQILYQVWLTMTNESQDPWHKVEEKAGISSYTFTNLKESTEYSFCIKAFDEAGNCLLYPGDDDCLTVSTDTPDTAAPTVSSPNLTVLNRKTNSISIQWKAASDNVTAASRIRYEVYLNGAKKYEDKGITSYTFTGLAPNTQYTFFVKAFDEAGNDLPYSTVAAKTIDDKAPTVGSSVITVTDRKVNSISIRWNAASDNDTTASQIRYEVYLNGVKKYGEKNITSYTFTGLMPYTQYKVLVKAFDEAGNVLTYTEVSTTTLDNKAPTVGSSVITVTDRKVNSISIRWNAASDNDTTASQIRYEVYLNGVKKYGEKNITSYTFTGLAPNTSYSFSVKAYDAAGNVLTYSSSSAKTLDNQAPTVSNSSISISNVTPNSFRASWILAQDNDTGPRSIRYQVYLYIGGKWVLQKEDPGISSYTFTGLAPDTQYYVFVNALDDAGNLLKYPGGNNSTPAKTSPPRVNRLTFTIHQGAKYLPGTDCIHLVMNYNRVQYDSNGNVTARTTGKWERKWSSGKTVSDAIQLPAGWYFENNRVNICIKSRKAASAGLNKWNDCSNGYVDITGGSLVLKLSGSYYSHNVSFTKI